MASITQKAEDKSRFARPLIGFANGRSAFRAFLESLDLGPSDKVLLPAYIGWSPKEGSGVFDPIHEVGVGFAFYRIGRDLSIDLADLRTQLETEHFRLLVLIHYFGFPAVGAEEATALARDHGAAVLEDEAHAMFTDWCGGLCGRLGDAVILSLHKMLPVSTGGALVLNPSLEKSVAVRLQQWPSRRVLPIDPMSYDLYAIARARQRNAAHLLERLAALGDGFELLFSAIPEGVTPQTLPVVVTKGSRDELYFSMNAAGFGVVSLYHTLIREIDEAQFPASHGLARRILNLPVHQDASPVALDAMVDQLAALLGCKV